MESLVAEFHNVFRFKLMRPPKSGDTGCEAKSASVARLSDVPPAGLIAHSDRGVQYAAQACQDLLKSKQVRQSMSSKGDCYDDAMMESWNARFKVEWVRNYAYVSRELGKLDIFTYIETHYNRRSLMARLGGLSPIQFEHKHAAEFRNQ